MSHTTYLSDDWLAIHDSHPSEVIFRKLAPREHKPNPVIYNPMYEEPPREVIVEVTIPYKVVRSFVASQVRNEQIRLLEQMSDDRLLRDGFDQVHGQAVFD